MELIPGKDKLSRETPLIDLSYSILHVEDNPGDIILVRELLKQSGIDFTLRNVKTLSETIYECAGHKFDIILLDLGLPDSIGLETLNRLQLFNVASPIVVMTGLDDEDTALESLRAGAQDYLVKNRLTPDNIVRGIKYGIERKKIQDLLRKNAKQFSLLSSATAEINECENIPSIYETVCRNISLLLDRAVTVAIELEERPRLYYSGEERLEAIPRAVEKITGLNLQDGKTESARVNGKISEHFTDGKLHDLNHNLLASINSDGSQSVISGSLAAPEMFANAIGFIRNDIVYGGLMIFAPEGIGADNASIIEAISNQVSLNIHRRIMEKDLKMSENRYRMLSEELEQKVRERTRDLENLNYNLNQELIERQMIEEALRKSEASLKELNVTKDKFFSIIAHDLKNPFTSLLGSTEVLNQKIDEMDTATIRELVQLLNDSAKSGYAILQNLLDWSRSQTGLITQHPEKIDLQVLVEENISELRLTCAKKEIYMVSDLQGPLIIMADKNMLNTVLRNLLGNAVKFTHRFGKVTISAEFGDNDVAISVKDTGIGIPEEHLGKLFRIDTKYTRPGTHKEQGTGLGLKLCREFVELQGGKIWARSTVSKGSEFIFSIPFKNNHTT